MSTKKWVFHCGFLRWWNAPVGVAAELLAMQKKRPYLMRWKTRLLLPDASGLDN
jgi:hypothetical protein